MWNAQSKRALRLVWYHKMFMLLIILMLLAIFGYHSFVTYHAKRIFSQRLYMYGMNHHIHGHLLKPHGTFKFETLLREPILETNSKNQPVYLLILISSSPHHQKNAILRDTIRNTWGNCQKLKDFSAEFSNTSRSGVPISCKLFFYMGRSKTASQDQANLAELKTHNDLVIGDFVDDYHNMTRKILFGMKWASDNFNAKYVLKTDDDIFMNVPHLLHLLNTKYSSVNNLYGGHVYYASVVRDKKHRHFVTYEELPDSWYPPFNKGGEMILSGHLLPQLVNVSTQIIRFQIDDAYVGLLMNRIGVRPLKIKEFALSQWLTYFVSIMSTCDLKALAGIGDNLDRDQMNYLYRITHHDATWFCVQLDSLLYYLLFLCMFLFIVFFFLKQRYCPWLTISIIKNSLQIFHKRLLKR